MARQMKDSGIEWIGEIPAHFQKYRIKNVAELHGRIGFRGYTTDDLVGAGEGPITLSPSNIRDMSMNYDKCSYITWAKYDESPEIQVHDGDILMVKTGSSYGKAAMVTALPMEATINPQLIVMSNFKVVPRFLNYCFHTEVILSQIENAVVGGTIPTMAQEKINNFFFFAPPLPEQQRIAAFLDRKCAEIDAVIEHTKTTIEEYKKLKQAVITEAVTKGVRSPRKMKDSGIEWIGEIPEGWDMVKITHILDYDVPYPIGDGDHGLISPDDYRDEGIPYLRVQNLGWGTPLSLDGLVYISEETNESVKNSTLHPNDVLFAKTGATIGKTGIVPENMPIANTTSHIGKITVSPWYSAMWVFYVLSSHVGYRQFWQIAQQKTTRPELAIAEVRAIHLPMPSNRAEQDEIVEYLKVRCVELEKMISCKELLLTELETYKKSLIYEYVTGKKEVP